MCSVWPQEVEGGPRVKSISVQRKELSTDGKDSFSQLTSSSLETFKSRPAEDLIDTKAKGEFSHLMVCKDFLFVFFRNSEAMVAA